MLAKIGSIEDLTMMFYKPREPKTTKVKEIKPFEPEPVLKWMEECTDEIGFPVFRTRFNKKEGVFYDGTPAAYAICWLEQKQNVDTVLFTDVPHKVWLTMACGPRDWRRVLDYFEVHDLAPRERISKLREKIEDVREILFHGEVPEKFDVQV